MQDPVAGQYLWEIGWSPVVPDISLGYREQDTTARFERRIPNCVLVHAQDRFMVSKLLSSHPSQQEQHKHNALVNASSSTRCDSFEAAPYHTASAHVALDVKSKFPTNPPVVLRYPLRLYQLRVSLSQLPSEASLQGATDDPPSIPGSVAASTCKMVGTAKAARIGVVKQADVLYDSHHPSCTC